MTTAEWLLTYSAGAEGNTALNLFLQMPSTVYIPLEELDVDFTIDIYEADLVMDLLDCAIIIPELDADITVDVISADITIIRN